MLRTYVDIVLDDCLMICDLRIIHNASGYFVAMPSKPLRDGRRADIAHPIAAEARRMIEEAVMVEYRKVVAEAETANIDPVRG